MYTGAQTGPDAHTHALCHTLPAVCPVSVQCWLLPVLVQHVLLMTLMQAHFLHSVWAAALLYKALWHIIPGRGCVKLHLYCCHYGAAWVSFSGFLYLPCNWWYSSLSGCFSTCCFDPYVAFQGEKWPPDIWQVTEMFSGRKVHSWAMLLFLDLCQDKRIFSSILYFDWSFFLYLITFVYLQKFSALDPNRSES